MSETRPDYYGATEDDPYEVVKVLEAWLSPEEMVGFYKGTIIRYMRRLGKKPGNTATQEMSKVLTYGRMLNDLLTKLGLPIDARIAALTAQDLAEKMAPRRSTVRVKKVVK